MMGFGGMNFGGSNDTNYSNEGVNGNEDLNTTAFF